MKRALILIILAAVMIAPACAGAYPESPHPYGDNLDQIWTYTAAAGTERMDVTFSDQTNVEEDFDFIYLLNRNGGVLGSYTGTQLAGQTITIEGDGFGVQLLTDESSEGDFYGFAVTNVVEHGVNPVTVTSVTPSVATADKGDAVTWTVAAEGSSAPFSYVYELLKDGEVIATSASTTQTTYTATLSQNGAYTVRVTATDNRGATDTFTGGDVIVDTLEIQSVTATETLVKAGLPMTWTVTAAGGLHPYIYSYKLYDSTGALVEEQGYTSAATYTKTLKKLDSFTLEATVQDARGDEVTMTGDTVTLYKTLAVGSITADVTSAVAGEIVTWTATVSGGKGAVHSVYEISCDGAVQTTLEYDGVSSIQYAPLTAGRYSCTVTCSDEEGTVITKQSGSVEVTEMAATDPSLFTVETIDGLRSRITGYTGSATAIRIPDTIDNHTITTIAASAFKNKSALQAVVIPDTVTTIGDEAFRSCIALNNVVFGQGVTSIGSYAFYGCNSLRAVHLPEGLTSLGGSAFRSCPNLAYANHPSTLTSAGDCVFLGTALKHFTIDEGVTAIAPNFFNGCTNITSFTFPSTLTGIGSGAFANNDNLKSITLPEGVTSLGYDAFINCHYLVDVNLSSTITTIDANAFNNCTRLTNINLPASLTNLGAGAFFGCVSLTDVNFPDGLTTVGIECFEGCTALLEADLPDTVTGIGWGSFLGCTSLEYFHYPLSWTNVISNTFGDDRIFYNCRALASVTVPETITEIPGNAFKNANFLTEVILPSTLKTINAGAFFGCVSLRDVNFPDGLTTLGIECFEGCTALLEADLPDTVTGIGWGSFLGCTSLEYFHYPLSWTNVISNTFGDDRIFYNCSSLASVTVPEGVTSILGNAFKNANYLTEVILPSTLKTINAGAFFGCVSLTEIDFPEGLTTIGIESFKGCTALREADLPDTVTAIGWGSFYNCSALNNFHFPLGWTSVITNIFGSGSILYNCSAISSVTVPEGITSIPANAFNNANCLTEIILPSTLTSIGGNAFKNCTSLTNVDLPASVTNLEAGAFFGCVSLREVNFPNGLTTVGIECFEGCTALLEADLPDTVTGIGWGSFYGCTSLEYFHYPLSWTGVISNTFGDDRIFCNCSSLASITVPEGVTAIPVNAFKNANYLTEIILPNTLKTISDSAFANCSSMTEIVIPKNVTTIGNSAFSGCGALTTTTIYQGVTSIGSNVFASHSANLVIRCYSGTTAETYASNNSITVELLSGDWLNWRVTSDGWLHIYGEGPMTNYQSGAAPWTERADEIYYVHIGDGVTKIGNYAFANLTELTRAEIPESVTSIGSYAFSGCVDLGRTYVSDAVTTIGSNAFRNCSKLSLVCFAGSRAQTYASANGVSYETITITWNLGLTSLNLIKGMTVELPSPLFTIQPAGVIGTRSWITSSDANIVSLNGNSLNAKNNGAATVTYTLNEHPATAIEVQVTVGDMNTMTLPSALTELQSGALSGVAAERVVLPATLTGIAADALRGNANLKQVVVRNGNLRLPAGLLNGCPGAVVICPKGSAAAADCAANGIRCVYGQ